jgi:hypothetical protein
LQAILYSALPGLITKGNVHAKGGVSFPLGAQKILPKSFRQLPRPGFGIEEAILAVWALVARFSRISQRHVAIFLPT